MFYQPERNDHGLPYNPYKSCIVPRPIGWISTLGTSGRVNLAPFSQFNNLGYDPPYVMFSAVGHEFEPRRKDSVQNAIDTGEFVYNMATYELRNAVDLSGQISDQNVDEMAAAGLTVAPSRLVKPPRVAESAIQFECKLHQIVVLPGATNATTNYIVIGRVIGVHIADHAFNAEGKIDIARLKPMARLGYMHYTTVDHVFDMPILNLGRSSEFTEAMAGGKPAAKA